MDYSKNMEEARREAERGSVLHTVRFVFDAWQWEENLPSDAEAQAREIFVLANQNRYTRPTSANIPIDIEFVFRSLRWRHAQQDLNSPWSHQRDTAAP